MNLTSFYLPDRIGFTLNTESNNVELGRAVYITKLAEKSLPTPEVCGSNPVTVNKEHLFAVLT